MVKVDRSLTKRGSANKAKFVLQKKDFSFLSLTGQPSAVSHLPTLQHRNPASLTDWSGLRGIMVAGCHDLRVTSREDMPGPPSRVA